MADRIIIGIDEVGRGPIAGPVAVCAFICRENFFDNLEISLPLRDSKKLTIKQREKWFKYLQTCKISGKCDFKVSYVSPEHIDKFGIVKCINKALEKSLLAIAPQDFYKIFLDGGLKAPKEFKNQETIIKGDEKIKVISCASIVAKVSRDSVMRKFAKVFPDYDFENNVGYGTKAHYKAIEKNGLTEIHRKTFINL